VVLEFELRTFHLNHDPALHLSVLKLTLRQQDCKETFEEGMWCAECYAVRGPWKTYGYNLAIKRKITLCKLRRWRPTLYMLPFLTLVVRSQLPSHQFKIVYDQKNERQNP
jgi:hypothetical protein